MSLVIIIQAVIETICLGPSHVGAGWDWGPDQEKGEMVMCYGKEPYQNYCAEPPCGILNPVNENVYKVLGNVYKDMQKLFKSDVFHVLYIHTCITLHAN